MAQSLFENGRALMEAGNLDRACPMFAESQRLDPGGGTLLNLALCHEKQGKLASALEEYGTALSTAIRDERMERVDFARERVDALRPRVPKLVVQAPASRIPGLSARIDGVAISPVAFGTPLFVDPGPHEIRASAPGRIEWSMRVEVSASQMLDVHVPELAELAPPREIARLSVVTYTAGAVAIAAFGTSIVTGAMAASANADANAKCNTERQFCLPGGVNDASRARTLAWISTGALAVGVVATAIAIFWPRKRIKVDITHASITPRFVTGGAAVVADGSF
jgi:hypothetical protein